MNSQQILDILVTEIRDTLPDLADQPITASDSMAELGVDSIERSEVILATLEKLELKIPLVELYGPQNIGELAELLHAKSRG